MYKIGDRIKFKQDGFFSEGTVNNVITDPVRGDEYTITWDDGFEDDEGTTYSSTDIHPLAEYED